MDNVFDLVDDFYNQDEELNSILQQNYAEGFLRLKIWQGTSESRLLKIWDYITVLCIYLGNSENFLGDMSRENFIDCVGWCCRNVSDFTATSDNIGDFLDVMAEFYSYLKKKHIISTDKAPVEAKVKLLADNKVKMLDNEGKFLPEYERYNLYSTPDLPAKVFLNIGERLQGLLETMQTFFRAPKYRRDIERANFLYGGILLSTEMNEKSENDEYRQTFWDYFLFDYHMIADDKTPLQHFYDECCLSGFLHKENVSRDVLQELLQIKFVLFEVIEKAPEGMFFCRNVLTDEEYMLVLPIEENTETDGYIFMGHIFYNDTMVLNFLRGVMMNNASRKRFFKVLNDAKEWFAIRRGGEMSWADFISRNSVFLRHVSLIYASYMRMEGFNYHTHIVNYKASKLLHDKVTNLIEKMMSSYSFSVYDIRLAQTMWSDYLKNSGKISENIRVAEIWAAGVIYNFITLNAVYTYNIDQIAEMCYGVPKGSVYSTGREINKSLKLEKHDPRYINEEGLLLMLLQ